ncbi:MAG: TonB-dependent receptor [Stenotrophobium sp.]
MKSKFPGLWLSCASLLCSAQVCAQEDVTTGTVLPEVVVTAQKTAQTLEQVPASVSTLDGDFIQHTGAYDFTALEGYVPNTTITMSPSSAQVSMRGLGTNNSNPAFDPSVGTVIDGVYYGRSSFLTGFFYDIDRLEVLRGPQGTLFGKNSTAGLLNLVTRAPSDTFGGDVDFLYGGNGDRSLRPALTLPVNNQLSMRIAGNYSRSDGVFYNTFLDRPENNPRQNSTRLRIRYLPADNWRVDLGAFTSQQRTNFNLYKLTRVGPAMRALLTSYDPRFNTDIQSRTNSVNVPSLERSLENGGNATVSHDMGGQWGIRELNLTSITGYADLRVDNRDLDADFSPVPFIRDTLIKPSPYQQFSEELRLSGSHPNLFGWGHKVNFLGGLYYFNSRFNTSDRFSVEDLGGAAAYVTAAQSDAGTIPLVPGNTVGGLAGALGPTLSSVLNAINAVPTGVSTAQTAEVDLNQTSQSYAMFGQIEHFFTEQWAWIGGVRIGLERKQASASSQSTSVLIPLISDQKNFAEQVGRNERDVSPKLGIKWTPSKSASAYATWSRGYKSGGFNGRPLNSDDLEYKPERAESYEIGAKGRIFGGSMSVSGALFSTDFQNLQITSLQNTSFVILNAAIARSQGFEASMRWLTPLTGASIDASVGLADARYLHYPNAPAPADSKQTSTTTGMPCNPNTPGVSTVTSCPPVSQDLSGRPLAFAPRWTASLVPSYSRYIGGGGAAVTFAMDVLYRDHLFLDTDDDQRKVQPSTTLINLRTILVSPGQSWSLILSAHNLTDRLVLDQVVDQPLAPGNFASVRTDYGRYYSADLAYTF